VKTPKFLAAALIAVCWIVVVPAAAQAQDDNTGTNPINFTYDMRFITGMDWLRDDGGSIIKNTFQFSAPLGRDLANLTGTDRWDDLGRKFALRVRGYWNTLSVDNPSQATVSGIGDLDARLLWLAHVNNKWGIAPGLEAFFNTASDDALGTGKTSLAPTLFVTLFNVLGRGSIFAPGYQYVFSVGGDPDRSANRSGVRLHDRAPIRNQRLPAPGLRPRGRPALRLELRVRTQIHLALEERGSIHESVQNGNLPVGRLCIRALLLAGPRAGEAEHRPGFHGQLRLG
jgi:hypothetical protein